jgi:3-carboxy-cis,cis-muconate cycloisomerase
MSGELFSPTFESEPMQEAVSDTAWLQALLDVEAALAVAEARAGVIPLDAAQGIRSACRVDAFDLAELGRRARGAGNVVVPLARALREKLPEGEGRYVHWGATSQDVLDSATMVIARRGVDIIVADLDGTASACARLAEEHVSTLMAGRTLLQQALPITFGLKAAGWLVAVLEARSLLVACRDQLAAQLGGAVGSLASLGDEGLTVLGHFAEELDLTEPVVPWHTARARVANLGACLGITAGTVGKLALDITLMSQTEVGEVAEPSDGGRGGSSTMPHKRNPIGATIARACATRVQAHSGTLLSAMAQEHERATGAWHAEWETLRDALALTGGGVAWMREVLQGLEVYPNRMRENLEITDGSLLAERVALLLAERIGRDDAHRLLEEATRRAAVEGPSLREVLLSYPDVTATLSAEEIDDVLKPENYLGSTRAFVRRALERYRDEVPRR